MDSDTTTRVGAHARLLDEFGADGDILVGTQMVAKGLDFPTVSLVGVVAPNSRIGPPPQAGQAVGIGCCASQRWQRSKPSMRCAVSETLQREQTGTLPQLRQRMKLALPRRFTNSTVFSPEASRLPIASTSRVLKILRLPAANSAARVDDRHGRQGLSRRPQLEPNVSDLTAQGARVALERRRGTPEHERPPGQTHLLPRDVERVITRHALLFVGALVRLVDDDQADAGKRSEQRAARADDDVDPAAGRRLPTLEPLAFRKARVKHADPFAEDALEAPRCLRRERDLGHQHDRAPAPGERSFDRSQIDQGLAASRNALHEHFGERLARDARIDRVDCRLLFARRDEVLLLASAGRVGTHRALLRLGERPFAERAGHDARREALEQRVAASHFTALLDSLDECPHAWGRADRFAGRREHLLANFDDARTNETPASP